MNITIPEYLNNLQKEDGPAYAGSTTALIGALSSSLASMILDIQKGKEAYEDKEEEMEEAMAHLNAARDRMRETMQEDIESFEPVQEALSMSAETEEEEKEREALLSKRYEKAAQPQIKLMKELGAIVGDLEFIVKLEIEGSLITDLAVSLLYLQSTIQAAHLNALANIKPIKDKEVQQALLTEINQLLTEKTQKLSFLFHIVTHYINSEEWLDIEAAEEKARKQLEKQKRQMTQNQSQSDNEKQ